MVSALILRVQKRQVKSNIYKVPFGRPIALSLYVRVYLYVLTFLTVLVCSKSTWAQDHTWRDEDYVPGYSEELKIENDETGEILYFVENPNKNEVKLQQKIFDKKISEEITTRYKEQFGRSEAEIIYERTPYLTNNFTESDSNVFSEEDYLEKQKKFGQFISKRLIEYHFEAKAKDDPALKTVYETKQKVEKIDVSLSKNFKLRMKYKISSNNLNLALANPYMDFNARLELGAFMNVADVDETVLTLSKEFLKSYSVATDYYLENPRWDILIRKRLNRVTLSLNYSPIRMIAGQKESQFILGAGLPF